MAATHNKGKATEAEIKEIVDLKENGYTIEAIATKVNRSKSFIRKKLKSEGITLIRYIKPEDLIGKRFGKLVVLQYVGTNDKGKYHYYKCKCDCGVEKIINRNSLVSGFIRSCGCVSKARRSRTHDVLGVFIEEEGDKIRDLRNSLENDVKMFKLNAKELEEYLKKLPTKEVQRRKSEE